MKFLSLPVLVSAVFLMIAAPSFAQSASLTATVRVNPLEVKLAAPSKIPVRDWFEIEVLIFNKGSEAITKISAKMHTPSELAVKGKRKRIGTLGPGEITKVIWQAKANQAGDFVIQVDVEGFLDGEKISESDSTLISATSSIWPFWLRFLFSR